MSFPSGKILVATHTGVWGFSVSRGHSKIRVPAPRLAFGTKQGG
jgi:hypothetical protein